MWTYLQYDHKRWIDPAGCHCLLCARLENFAAHHWSAHVQPLNPALVSPVYYILIVTNSRN